MDKTLKSKIKQKIKILKDIEQKLPIDKYFSITRLRNVNVLCDATPHALITFAFFIAAKTTIKIHETKEESDEIKSIAKKALKRMEIALDEMQNTNKITDSSLESLKSIYVEIFDLQKETKTINFGTLLRLINNVDILIIEDSLNCYITVNKKDLGYALAKDYVERYNPKYGTGIIIDSLPLFKDIIDFWEDYYSEIYFLE